MTRPKTGSRSATVIRWIARVWSLVLLAIVLLMLLTPDPNATEPMLAEDWFLLGLWALAFLWLLVAWRWELVGGILAIATMFVRELAWVLIKGDWFVGFLFLWAAFVSPAILFLVAWGLDRRSGATKA